MYALVGVFRLAITPRRRTARERRHHQHRMMRRNANHPNPAPTRPIRVIGFMRARYRRAHLAAFISAFICSNVNGSKCSRMLNPLRSTG